MSIPALQALRHAHPNAHIAILARPWVAGLYGREPFCDQLISYDAPKGWSGLGRKFSIARKLRESDFDCAVLLQNAFEAAAFVWAARIPHRIGYKRDGRRFLLTVPVQAPRAGEIPKHQRFYYLELLRRAGLIENYSTDTPIALTGAPAAAESGRRFLSALAINGPVLAVAPGAAYGGAKRWPAERFAGAAVDVSVRCGFHVVVVGTKNESAIGTSVARDVQSRGVPVTNLVGRTTLAELIDVLAASQALITNDSGPMHLASALGVPTVAVFGATDHLATGPAGASVSIVRVPVDCSPCLLRECPIDHRCMTAITPRMVAVEAITLLERTKIEYAK